MHPITQNKSILWYYSLAWIILAAIHAAILSLLLGYEPVLSIIDALLSNLFFGVLGLSFWYPTKFLSIEKGSAWKLLLNHLAAAAFAVSVWLGGGYVAADIVNRAYPGYLLLFGSNMPWRFLIGVLYYWIIIGYYYVHIYYQNYHNKLIRESELDGLLKEAELKTLKFQINPHFIYNSLNSVNALIMTKPALASEMTVKLADYMRYTLSSNEQSLKPLGEELKAVMLYLDIEKTRFADKIQYSQEVPEEALNIPIPNMLLQPLFENAIKHGVYESLEPVNINLKVMLKENFLIITLSNDRDPESVSQSGEQVGLKNIRSRLQLLYQQPKLLQIEKNETQFTAKVYIPL